MNPGAQAKIRPQAAGSLISCARATSVGSTATRFIENNARYVEYCGAECVGLYYTCINSYPTPEKPRPGPMSSAVLRRVPNRVRRRLFAGGLEGTGFELLVRRVCELLVPKRRSPICSSFKIMRPEPLHRVASQSIALGVVLV
jgi:hypothetical protein